MAFEGPAHPDRNKTIGIIGEVSPWMNGGAAVHPAELMKALGQRYSFKAVTLARSAQGRDSHASNVRTVQLVPYVSRIALVLEGIRFLSDVDLIHVHDPRFFPVKQFLRKKMVTTFHGYLTLEAMANYHTRPGLPRYELYRRTLRGAVKASDHLIAVDTRIGSWLREEFSGQNISVVPNGVDVQRFRPMTASKEVLESVGLAADGLTILAAKDFVPKNGMEYLVRAMPFVLDEIPDARLILAGRGKLREDLVSLIGGLGLARNVTMPGLIPNAYMPDVIASCDIGVIPSVPVSGVEEATSILMLEMMACGKLVVASAIGGLRETIRHGETGLLVEPGQPVALAKAIISGLNDPGLRLRIGATARMYVERNNSWQSVGARVANIYESLLAS